MLPDHILISENPGSDLHAFLAKKNYSKTAILVDENTQLHCLPLIEKSVESANLIQIKSGESQKNIQTCQHIWNVMTNHQLDRHSVLIILGGGVLGDMGGFCAATYKRGIDFILIPTTLLAQVDSSIGGKLGIDFENFKNHIGVFREPALNLIHEGFLKTLPENELRSGFAEVIKHCLISDKAMWEEIRSKGLFDQDWNKLIRHSSEFKSSIVRQDPYEKNIRKTLNAGHTIGHAIEGYFLSRGQPVLHGEAVAAGLVAESWIAAQHNLMDPPSLQETGTYILSVFSQLKIPKADLTEIAERCLQDKKNKGNKILCVLPNGIGRARLDVEISLEEIVESLAFYSSLQM